MAKDLVRNLERDFKLARKVVKKVVAGNIKVKITNKNLSDFLWLKYKFGELESQDRVGIVTGLVDQYGGEI